MRTVTPRFPEDGRPLVHILAVGDGVATLVGRRRIGPELPWNPTKSIAAAVCPANGCL